MSLNKRRINNYQCLFKTQKCRCECTPANELEGNHFSMKQYSIEKKLGSGTCMSS